MMMGRHILVVIGFLLTTACSQEDIATEAKQTQSQEAVEKKVGTLLQPQMNVLKKAKELENKLKKAEEKRLKTIEGFGE